MKVRIAIAGDLTDDKSLYVKIDYLIGQVTGFLCKTVSDAEIQLLVSQLYMTNQWVSWCNERNFSICTYNILGNSEYDAFSTQIIHKDTKLRSNLGEAICDKADAIIAVWNENVTELLGATWEILHIAHDRRVPCIWISSKTKQEYCLWESYYHKYTPQYLEEVIVPISNDLLNPIVFNNDTDMFFGFWKKRRNKYLKKYKANIAIHPSKEDYILKENFEMEKDSLQGTNIRQLLVEKFNKFDEAAIELNTKFQTMLYARSILPFIATIFLAIGFYVETLVGTVYKYLYNNTDTLSKYINPKSITTVQMVALILAGVGFLIHGMLNLYVYRLSKSKKIIDWQVNFASNRYTAEILRILIHFLPYGVEMNLRKLCGTNLKLYNDIKHLTDNAEPKENTIDRNTFHHVLSHTNEMLEDQIAYHKLSVERYNKIVNSLTTWGKRIFYIGFGFVIGRGILQFIIVYPKLTAADDTIYNILRSFLNMLALLLPAWAGYFTTKLQQNNFRYNLNNHEDMLKKMSFIKEKVVRSLEQEEIPNEIVNAMIEELAEIMLVEDTYKWQLQYMNSSVKPL